MQNSGLVFRGLGSGWGALVSAKEWVDPFFAKATKGKLRLIFNR